MPARPQTASHSDKVLAQELCDMAWAAQMRPFEAAKRHSDIDYALTHGHNLPKRLVLTRNEALHIAASVRVSIPKRATTAEAVLTLALSGRGWRVKCAK